MTNRDWFAAAALAGLLAAPTDKDRSWGYWARCAYESADAMLAERERVTESLPKEKRAEVSSQACPYVVGRTTLHCSLTPFTLTPEERDAIKVAMHRCDTPDYKTLLLLLERTRNGSLEGCETVQ